MVDEPDIEYLIKEPLIRSGSPKLYLRNRRMQQRVRLLLLGCVVHKRRTHRPRPQGPPRARQFREVNCLAPPRPRP
jgi:hypothetical protein